MLTKTKQCMLNTLGVKNESVFAKVIKISQLELAFIGELPELDVEKFVNSEFFSERLSHPRDQKVVNIRDFKFNYKWTDAEVRTECYYDLQDEEGNIVSTDKHDWNTFDLGVIEEYLIWPSERTYKLEA